MWAKTKYRNSSSARLMYWRNIVVMHPVVVHIFNINWQWWNQRTNMGEVSGCHYYLYTSQPTIDSASNFAADLKIDSFHASIGWLRSFLKCKNIVFGSVNHGESGDVDMPVKKYVMDTSHVTSSTWVKLVWFIAHDATKPTTWRVRRLKVVNQSKERLKIRCTWKCL